MAWPGVSGIPVTYGIDQVTQLLLVTFALHCLNGSILCRSLTIELDQAASEIRWVQAVPEGLGALSTLWRVSDPEKLTKL